jgi:hypothetical protein
LFCSLVITRASADDPGGGAAGESADSAEDVAEDPVAMDVAEDDVEEAADDPGVGTEDDAPPVCDDSPLATSLVVGPRAGDVGLPPAAADGAADEAGSAPDHVSSDPEEDLGRESPPYSVLDEFPSCTPSCVLKKPLQQN